MWQKQKMDICFVLDLFLNFMPIVKFIGEHPYPANLCKRNMGMMNLNLKSYHQHQPQSTKPSL